MSIFRFKILLSLIFAFILSSYLSRSVFLAGTPIVRPDAVQNVLSLPGQAQTAVVRTLAHFSPIKSPPPSNPSKDQGGWFPTAVPNNTTPVQAQPTNPPAGGPSSLPTPTQGYVYISPTPTITPVPGVPTQPPQPTATVAPVTKAQFAQCVTSKGMKFYVNAGCPYCKQTKAEFGTAYQYISEVNCDQQQQLCRSIPGVGIGPAWLKPDGGIVPGAMDFQSLSYVSSCQKPTL